MISILDSTSAWPARACTIHEALRVREGLRRVETERMRTANAEYAPRLETIVRETRKAEAGSKGAVPAKPSKMAKKR
ncbi:MAG TPA: hypothetical protein VF316_17575 [Polyangiaceae bacterium]